MKRILPLLLVCAILAGCGTVSDPVVTEARPTAPESVSNPLDAGSEEIPYVSRFKDETVIRLTDGAMNATGVNSWFVSMSKDIIYYEDRETYDSGNPYGEGEDWQRHSMDEAQNHLVLNITAPGAYRVSGTWTAGQIRVDLGDDAYEDENAVVELILDGADITCTVAPAILFQNVYECDGAWDKDTASPDVDTAQAGANLILVGENNVTGSHVAKIYKDKKGEKKLWKQDGAIYSYMSMNVWGPGTLNLTADNEGMDTELHLTVNGGDISIRSDNDGINTNEDGVSVTTINGGRIHIAAGLGAEGDGIDSNGYLVINGGVVVASANPASDAGLDSDLGSFIHGGTVIAMGSAMDWAESDSDQVTMNLQFASYQSPDSAIAVTGEDGTLIFAYDPGEDEILGENARRYQGLILSCGSFRQGETYLLYADDTVTGTHRTGIYDPGTVTDRSGGMQLAFTGTDVMTRPGGMGGFGGGQRPDDGRKPEDGMSDGQQPPEGFGEGRQPMNGGEMPSVPEGWEPPANGEGMQEGEMPTGPEGQRFPDGRPGGRNPGQGGAGAEGANTLFYMQDKVNFFTGLTSVQ